MKCGATLIILWVAAIGCTTKKSVETGAPTRVISLTPSVTEIVLAIGGRDRLIAVDKFSHQSKEIAARADLSSLPVAGDFVAPNVEVIAKLDPQLIIFDAAQAKAEASLSGAGYRTLIVPMHSTGDVRVAIASIALALELESQGRVLTSSIETSIAAAKTKASATTLQPQVLWIIDRQPGALTNLIGAGSGSYADELISLAGGRNVLASSGIRYPKISREALARLEIDLVLDSSGAAQESMAAWKPLDQRVIQKLPTSAATPRPGLGESLDRVSEAIARVAQQRAPR